MTIWINLKESIRPALARPRPVSITTHARPLTDARNPLHTSNRTKAACR